MPPFLAVLGGAVGAFALVRWAVKTARRVNDELEAARQAHLSETAAREQIPTLRRDPVTGAYRPN